MNIKINGEEFVIEGDRRVDYKTIFALAFPGQDVRDGATITYHWRGEGDVERNGTLFGDKTVTAAPGMIFNCMFTGNA